MKLSEVKSERVFNLEISESDLRWLIGRLIFFPSDSQWYTDKPHHLAEHLIDLAVADFDITQPSRAEIIREN